MKNRKVIVGLALFSAVLLGSNIFLYLELAKAKQALIAVLKQRNQLRLEQLAAATDNKAENRASSVPTLASLDLNSVQKNPAVNAVLSKWVEIMNRPETVDLMADQQRAAISSRYGGLFSSLNLPPEKLGKVKQLLVERELAFSDAVSTSFKQGMNPLDNLPAFQQMINGSQTEIDSQIKGELGPKEYDKYTEYQNNQGSRSVVGDVAASLSYTKPLSREQQALLEHTLAVTGNDSENMTGKLNSGANVPRNPDGVITEATIETASTFLAPEQVAALTEQRQAQIAKWKLQQMYSGEIK